MPRLRGDNSDQYYEDDNYDTPYTAPTPDPTPAPTPGPAPQASTAANPTEWSRGQEDQWINFANQNYGGQATGNLNDIISNYNKTFNTNAKVVGSDKVDFGYGASDVIKNVNNGAGQLWLGDYPDPNHVSPNSGGGGGGNSAPSYSAPSGGGGGQQSNSNGLDSFMGQAAPVHRTQNFDEIMANLKKLFPDGAYNQDIVNRRTENARENLLRQRKSTDANDRAILANRGTLGSGPEITALTRADQNMADQYQNATSGIYADEENAASQRMMQALQTAAGMDANEAAAFVNAYTAQTGRGLGVGNLGVAQQRADNDFTLGSGNLALGNVNSANNYNLGLANFGLNRDTAQNNATDQRLGRIIQLLNSGVSIDEILAGGYIDG